MTASIAAPLGADLGLDRPAARNRAQSRRTGASKQKRTAGRSKARTRERTTPRTSEILRRLLEDESRKSFTIEEIVSGLGPRSLPTSLMLFTIPEVLPIPIPGLATAVVIPTGIISYQMFRGQEEISLPKWLLDRSVPRSAFAPCVGAILPFLEKAEGKVRPRWRWASSRTAKRFIDYRPADPIYEHAVCDRHFYYRAGIGRGRWRIDFPRNLDWDRAYCIDRGGRFWNSFSIRSGAGDRRLTVIIRRQERYLVGRGSCTT
jgi:hypothetical protein